MKKNFFTTFIISLFLFNLNAQITGFEVNDVDHGNILVSNNSEFALTTNAFATSGVYFQIKNISPFTQTLQIIKEDVLLNITNIPDTAKAYFCTGTTCYLPSTNNVTIPISANEVIDFRGDLDEASKTGYSEVKYKFINGGQVFSFVLKYNGVVSVIENSATLSNISNVFPNPTAGNAFINVNVLHDQTPMNMQVINSLGSVISSKDQFLNKGKNTLSINTEALKSGIYFVSLKQSNSVITKKITVVN
ncbi:T9SS type A sorting domain-containing protein [Aurantibacillus circumpalustris]|uniref:T9SS type A sorting domain-containing protein n=1 Tax=Aurantibacillus circumpalustris TaxID=3036359 RepID=UPI00295B3B82|nr:T9SS type A sorting domain-containing protein [Aurantibacillus circumpalustris]